MTPIVAAVSASPTHTFSKPSVASITLLAGFGVAGDAHGGERVQHRSRVRADPRQPNLRQVHLIHRELLDDLGDQGFRIGPGMMGENITTAGIDLLALPSGCLLHIGQAAVVRVTGLRNPCRQLDDYQHGLMAAVLERDESGRIIRKAGIMGVVVESGAVHPGDAISVTLPREPFSSLECV